MKLVVGLGNPDEEYKKTRHNAGFKAVELFAGNARFTKKWDYSVTVKKEEILIAKPMTYMNRSGEAVKELISFFKFDISQILIICDDFTIPAGVLRLRMKGSSGGHRGLQSIADFLQSHEFPRLRIGVGPVPEGIDPAEFVLEKMNKTDEAALENMTKKASECIDYIIHYGIEKAMNKYNSV